MLKKGLLQAAQKDPEARRAKNRRAEAYIGSTLTRGDCAQRSIWVFFSSLLDLKAVELCDIVMADHPLIGLGTAREVTVDKLG